MDADRQVEAEADALTIQPSPQVEELPARGGLRNNMKALFVRIDLIRAQVPRASGGGPRAPIATELRLRPAEPRVAGQLGVDFGWMRRRPGRERRPNLDRRLHHVEPLPRGGGTMRVPQVAQELGPEEPADGGVGAGFGWRRIERGKQGKEGDNIPSQALQPPAGRLEVSKVPEGPGARRAQCRELGADAPAPLPFATPPRRRRRG